MSEPQTKMPKQGSKKAGQGAPSPPAAPPHSPSDVLDRLAALEKQLKDYQEKERLNLLQHEAKYRKEIEAQSSFESFQSDL